MSKIPLDPRFGLRLCGGLDSGAQDGSRRFQGISGRTTSISSFSSKSNRKTSPPALKS
jgi:hypothetical protein